MNLPLCMKDTQQVPFDWRTHYLLRLFFLLLLFFHACLRLGAGVLGGGAGVWTYILLGRPHSPGRMEQSSLGRFIEGFSFGPELKVIISLDV